MGNQHGDGAVVVAGARGHGKTLEQGVFGRGVPTSNKWRRRRIGSLVASCAATSNYQRRFTMAIGKTDKNDGGRRTTDDGFSLILSTSSGQAVARPADHEKRHRKRDTDFHRPVMTCAEPVEVALPNHGHRFLLSVKICVHLCPIHSGRCRPARDAASLHSGPGVRRGCLRLRRGRLSRRRCGRRGAGPGGGGRRPEK
jgi:hypothetical protein